MIRRGYRLAAAASAALLVISLPGAGAGASPDKPLARNVIVLISDGAGYATHELGSLYATGAPTEAPFDEFPFRFATTTHSYGDVPLGTCGDLVGYDPEQAWGSWSYVTVDPTDSASAATAIATGTKTYDRAIGVDCAGQAVDNVIEVAEALGKSTGVVTSVPFSHATPAAFVAHDPDRDHDRILARQMIDDSFLEVFMGGGHPEFDRYGAPSAAQYQWLFKDDWLDLKAGKAGRDVDGDGVADPFTLVQTRAAFQALATGPTPGRVAGVFQSRRTLQADRVDLATLDPGTIVAPYSVPFNPAVPTLSEMAAGALNVLDDDPDGFVLMIEGGAIDWAAHDQQPGLMVEEELAFHEMVETVVAWVEASSNWGETLVIVTSDHETGYVTGPGSGDTGDGPVWTSLEGRGPGVLPGVQVNVTTHTNSLVPVYAKGDAGRLLRAMVDGIDPVHGPYLDNTDIHALIVRALGEP